MAWALHHIRAVLFRSLFSLCVAAVLVPATLTTAEAQRTVRQEDAPRGVEVEDGGGGGESGEGWRALTGLRLEQWIAPAGDHLRFDVRLTLPEMALGKHFSIETFSWERLDVAEEDSERRDDGAVYHLVGARYRQEAGGHAFFVGAP